MKKLIILISLLIPGILQAQTAYVTDSFEVSVRSGQSTRNKILKMLRSGSPVTVLNEDENGYTQIRTSQGVEGWVLSRYLSNSPSAKQQLQELQQSLEKIKSENDSYRQELGELRQDHSQVSNTREQLSGEVQRLESELNKLRKTSANAMRTERQRDQLQGQVVTLEKEREQLARQVEMLENSDSQTWYLLGAGVLFAGMLLGLILPKISWRPKRTSWDSF